MSRVVQLLTVSTIRLILMIVPICTLPNFAHSQETFTSVIDTKKVAQIKAVYLWTFGLLIRWPEQVAADNEYFTIGVLGDEPALLTNLDQVAKRRKIHQKSIQVQHFETVEIAAKSNCQILYIAPSVAKEIVDEAIKAFSNSPVLVVTDSPDRPQNTQANFFIEDAGVHFELNNEEAQRKKLAMDARLLNQGRMMQTASPSIRPN